MLKTKQLSDLEGAEEDLKNKAMILQTGIDLQALLRLLVDKGIISREEIRMLHCKPHGDIRAVRSGALR